MPHTLVWIAQGTSPADPSTFTNWLGEDNANHAPANGDTLVFNGLGVAPVSPIDQHTIAPARIIVTSSNTANCGTDATSTANAVYWQIAAVAIDYGVPQPTAANSISSSSGANLFLVNVGSATCTVTTYSSNSSNTGNYPAFCVLGTVLTIESPANGGDVGVAARPGETATIAAANVGGGTAVLGSGVTATSATVTVNGTTANLIANCAIGTLTSESGTSTVGGIGEVTTVNANGGTVNLNNRPASGSAIGTLNLNGADVNFAGNPAAFTVGASSLQSGSINVFSSSQGTFTGCPLSFGTKNKITFTLS